jgi:hypothetical protein
MKMATAAKAAKHICLSVSRFRDLVDSEVIARQPPGQYDLKAVRESYIPHMQKLAAGRGADHGAALSTQRARLATAQAQAAEMKNAAFCGDLVSLDLVEKKLNPLFHNFREQALSTPGIIADAVASVCGGDRALIYRILDDRLREMLTELADGKIAAVSELRPRRHRGAAANIEEPA